MALTRTEALRQVVEILEEISAKLNRSHTVTVGQRSVIIDITGIITELKSILLELGAQSTTLTSIDGKDFATQATLALLEGKDFATQATVATLLLNTTFTDEDFAQESGGNLAALAGIDFFLSGDTTDGGDLLNELESIDQNWNLLSVNNIALLALTDFQEDTRDNTQEIEDLLIDIEVDTDDIANRMNLLIRQFEQQWSRTYTCTVAGSLILTFTVPLLDNFQDTGFSFAATFSATRTVTVVRQTGGGGTIEVWEGGHGITTLTLKPIPNQGASSISKLPGNNGFRANATETIVLTISGLTAVLPDVVTVRLTADKFNSTLMATPIVGGTGTFTTSPEIRTVVTRF